MTLSAPSKVTARLSTPFVKSRQIASIGMVVVALLYGLFVVGRLRDVKGNPAALIRVGSFFLYSHHPEFTYSGTRELAPGIPINSEAGTEYGYDGQYFYRLALDPATRTRAAYGLVLDNPAYRQQRIGYPLLIHLFSLRQPALVPWTMLLVNYAAILSTAYVGMLYARSMKLSPLWGLVFALCPGYLFTVSRDVAEVVQGTFLLMALYLLRRDKPIAATFALIGALLTRETALLVAATTVPALLLANYTAYRRKSAPAQMTQSAIVENVPGLRWYFVGVPLVVFVCWQAFLYKVWGEIPVRAHPSPFTPRLDGLRQSVEMMLQPGPYHRFWLLEIALWGGFSLLTLAALFRSRAYLHEKLFFGISLVVALTLGYDSWREDWGYMRLLAELFTGSWLVLLNSPRNVRLVAAFLTVGMWLLVAGHLLFTHR